MLTKINEEDNDIQGWRCARLSMEPIVINYSSQERIKSFILPCSSSYCFIPNYFKKTQRCVRGRLSGDIDCNVPRRLAIFLFLRVKPGSDVVSNCIIRLFSFYWLLRWNLDIMNLYIAKYLVKRTIFFTLLIIVKYKKKNLDITEPLYGEQILPVPWAFVMSRLHCTSLWGKLGENSSP